MTYNLKTLHLKPQAEFFKNENGAQQFSVTVDRYYNGWDLSTAYCYLMVEFADGSCDKFLLEKTFDEESLTASTPVLSRMQRVAGTACFQLSFDCPQFSVKSSAFEITISESVADAYTEYVAIPSALERLLDLYDEEIDNLQEGQADLEGGIGDVNSLIEENAAKSIDTPIEKTYAELAQMKSQNKLKVGQSYRITDFVTTVSATDVSSANHPFDVIVTANSANSFYEDATAAVHAGDSYFASSDLGAWKIKYCFENDAQRFSWADAVNGKGVVFYMEDEWGNVCPYDFKNVMFKRYARQTFGVQNSGVTAIDIAADYDLGYKIEVGSPTSGYVATDTTISDALKNAFSLFSPQDVFPLVAGGGDGVADWQMTANDDIDYFKVEADYKSGETREVVYATAHAVASENGKWFFTFSHIASAPLSAQSEVTDATIATLGGKAAAYSNAIKPYYVNGATTAQDLNNVVFVQYSSGGCHSNYLGEDCRKISFGDGAVNNMIYADCHDIIFGGNCVDNEIKSGVYSLRFGSGCVRNEIAAGSHDMSFCDGAVGNAFLGKGEYCYFLSGATSNVFGDGLYYCSFGINAQNNRFGAKCREINVSSDFAGNVLEGDNISISFASGFSRGKAMGGVKYLSVTSENVINACFERGFCGNSAIDKAVIDHSGISNKPYRIAFTKDEQNAYLITWRSSGDGVKYAKRDGTSGVWSATVDTISRFDDYAQKTGYYKKMSVGVADQLSATLGSVDQTPYNFRTSGGSADIGPKAYTDLLRGVTLDFNQMSTIHDVQLNATSGNVVSTYGECEFHIDHYYYLFAHIKWQTSGNAMLGFWTANNGQYRRNEGWTSNSDGIFSAVQKGTYLSGSISDGTKNLKIVLQCFGNSSDTVKPKVISCMVVDLTRLFGSNDRIPPYFSAVDFRRMFPETFYPCTNGTFISTSVTGYKTVGYNAFTALNTFIPVVCGSTYAVEGVSQGYVDEYDADENLLKTTALSSTTTVTMTSITNKIKIRASVYKNVCLHLSWSGGRTGYDERVENDYAVTFEGKGIYGVSGDELSFDGEKIVRYKEVDLADLDWTVYSGNYWVATFSDMESGTSDYIVEKIYPDNVSVTDKTVVIEGASMPTGKMVYKLETPVLGQGVAFSRSVSVDDYGTETFITTNGSVVGHSTFYQANLHDFLQRMYTATNGVPATVPHATLPISNGNYKLRATVSGGEITYSWVSDS